MAEQAGFVQGGVERMSEEVARLQKALQKSVQSRLHNGRKNLGKQLSASRRNLERQVTNGRKNLERSARKRVRELRRHSLVKRVQSLRGDLAAQFENGVSSVLGTLQIASKGDLQRIDRRLGQINRKIKELERTRRSNGSAPAA